MLVVPALDGAAGGFADDVGKNKGVGIASGYQFFELAQFQPCDDGKNTIAGIAHAIKTGQVSALAWLL